MTEWHRHILAFHNLDNADNPDSLVLGQAASETALSEFEELIGYKMPAEFRQIYSEFDGFGSTRDSDTEWFFVPISNLIEHSREVLEWFQQTHPEIAKRFVPFVDWGSGDASGYLFSESGLPESGIFMFEHESYDFEAGQNWHEFLFPVDDNICDFLTE
jgi:hypothetical protein